MFGVAPAVRKGEATVAKPILQCVSPTSRIRAGRDFRSSA